MSTPSPEASLSPELRRKLDLLARVPRLDPASVLHFGSMLARLSPWQLARMAPIQLAVEHGFELQQLVDLLMHGTRVGICELNWTVVCPGCGSIEYTYETINALKGGAVFCVTCNRDVAFSLDEQVEVSFRLHAGMRPDMADFDPYADFESYTRSSFSASMQHSQAFEAFVRDHLRGFAVAAADASVSLPLELRPGGLYRVINQQSHSQFWLRADEAVSPLPQVVETDLGEHGFAETERRLQAGPASLRLHNRTGQRRALTLWEVDFAAAAEILRRHPVHREAFFTAKLLLNSQTFREIYRVQQLDPDLRLSIGSQTLLFTDLKGSTAMYEATGDYQAYSVVQRHFELLTECTRRHAGSVVKTIGDAIMAAFSRPIDGLLAALDMQQAIAGLNHTHPEAGLGLKVGLHTGPVLAVNANERLDFFGQTVNLAARVQGLAEAGEIWLTEAIYTPEVAEALTALNYGCSRQSAFLKGISAATPVWRCTPD